MRSTKAPAPPVDPVVTLRGVTKRFASGTLALDQLDLAVRNGEFVSLLGPSGCGKSTALRLIAGLGEPTRGTISWSGTPLPTLPLPPPSPPPRAGEGWVGAMRGRVGRGVRNKPQVGFVFQEP